MADDESVQQQAKEIASAPTPVKATTPPVSRAVHAIHEKLPDATIQECKRFLVARKGDVDAGSEQLKGYLEWRRQVKMSQVFPLNASSDDYEDWMHAVKGAAKAAPPESKSSIHSTKLPRMVSCYSKDDSDDGNSLPTARNGTRVVYVLPALLDVSLAPAPTYALAVALYLDRKVDRESAEKVTVVIDLRGGSGWANPTPMAVLPFFQTVAGLLNAHFPERLSQCVMFPLPWAFSFLFGTAKGFLDPDTAEKIQVCSGAANMDSPIPESLEEFFEKDVIQTMESRRLSLFVADHNDKLKRQSTM